MHTVVIGAGLLGATTAYFLRRHGMEVTVFEGRTGPALGASYGNGGYLQATVPDPWNAPGVGKIFMAAWMASLKGRADDSPFVAKTAALPGLFSWGRQFMRHAKQETYLDHTVKNWHLAQYTLAVTEQIAESADLQYDASTRGGLILFRSDDSLTAYEQLARHMSSLGAEYERLNRDALFEREPSLAPLGDQLVGAIYYPKDRAGNSRKFCEGLIAATQNMGARVEYNQPVASLASTADGVRVILKSSEVMADAVVIAAGVTSRSLANKVGISLPIAPAKGYSISVPMSDWDVKPQHVMADMGVHAGINPMGDTLRVAGTAEFSGENLDVTRGRVSYLIDLLRALYPDRAKNIDHDAIDPWAGLRPLSADGLPIIGETPVRGVYINSGHGGLGWTQAAGSGKALADRIAGLEPELDLKPYSPSRF